MADKHSAHNGAAEVRSIELDQASSIKYRQGLGQEGRGVTEQLLVCFVQINGARWPALLTAWFLTQVTVSSISEQKAVAEEVK